MKRVFTILIGIIISLAAILTLVGCIDAFAPHVHEYEPSFDEDGHFMKCECGDKIDCTPHTLDWVIDKEPTFTEPGYKHQECECGYALEKIVTDRLLGEEISSSDMLEPTSKLYDRFNSKKEFNAFFTSCHKWLNRSFLCFDTSSEVIELKYSLMSDVYSSSYKIVNPHLLVSLKLYTRDVITSVDDASGDNGTVTFFMDFYEFDEGDEDYKFTFHEYDNPRNNMQYLIKVLHGTECVGRIYYRVSSSRDIGREEIASYLSAHLTAVKNEDKNADVGGNIPDGVNATIISSDDVLIVNLIAYLRQLMTDYDMISRTTADKINKIKNGAQPLLIDFTASEPYFVCAYYNSISSFEFAAFCCAEEYTWVRINNLDEIPEKYNNQDLFLIFQIDEATTVKNILSEGSEPDTVLHYHLYRMPQGIITPPNYERTFIYLNSFDGDCLYYTTDMYNHRSNRLSCVNLDGSCYLKFELYRTYGDTRKDADYSFDFDIYHDELINLMIPDRYSVKYDNGTTVYYGVIDINSFVNLLR